MKEIKINKEYTMLALLISGWLIIIGLLGNYLTDLLDIFFKNTLLIVIAKIIILFLIFLIFLLLLYKNKKMFKFYTLSNETSMKDDSFKALILPISILRQEITFSYECDNGDEKLYLKENDIENIKNFDDIYNIVEQKNIKKIFLEINNKNKEPYKYLIFQKNESEYQSEKIKNFMEWLKEINEIKWSWAVPLLILSKNSKSIEHIRLICTKNTNNQGSMNDINKLQFIIFCLFNKLGGRNGIIVHEIESFEKFSSLSKLLEKIEEDFEKEYNFNEEEIAFDITGGNKPVSVIGTFFTLKSKTPILYISQESEFGMVWQINAVINIKPPE